MNDGFKASAKTAQLGGAKRKNGHKANCSCHICENMKNKAKRGGYEDDMEKEEMKKMGGSKKKNGHKMSCCCPICKNMKNAKKGGYSEEQSEGEYNEMDKNDSGITGGKRGKGKGTRKSNGHKANCRCPICKNMKKKTRKGGEDPDIENQLGDIEEGQVKGTPPSETLKPVEVKPVVADDDDYDEVANALDLAEKGQVPVGDEHVGGSRKKRGTRKSNGHKSNCCCPICKNMARGKKTRRHKKRSNRRH